MGLVINTNVQSINAQRILGKNNSMLNKSYERLSSGFRINRASDDVAGLQISEVLRSQIRGTAQANSNVQDGINLLNTAEGALGTITDSLQRVRELVVQGANDTLSQTQRSAINKEIFQVGTDITRIANSTKFNGLTLLDSSLNTMKIQVGADKVSTTNMIDMASLANGRAFSQANATSLGLFTGATQNIKVNSNVTALRSLSIIDVALTTINNRRGVLGAMSNRLTAAGENLLISNENFSASESRIRNVDVAKESASLTRNNILVQAASNILSQANSAPNLALSLIRGQ
jgi:flagellin